MKPDTERKKYYNARLHKKKDFLHVHLSKDLRQKLKIKKRALLIHKGDKVMVMRGSGRNKTGKVAKVNYNKSKVYIEGISNRTARGKEILVALEPSNLLLLEAEMTHERKELFRESVQPVVSHERIKVEHPKVISRDEAKPAGKDESKG